MKTLRRTLGVSSRPRRPPGERKKAWGEMFASRINPGLNVTTLDSLWMGTKSIVDCRADAGPGRARINAVAAVTRAAEVSMGDDPRSCELEVSTSRNDPIDSRLGLGRKAECRARARPLRPGRR